MDFKQLYPSGENNVSNADLLFMQYSNYFGISAIGKGLDPDNEGLTIAGCTLVATHNQSDDTITALVTDGYVVIGGKQTKVESTPQIQFLCAYFNGVRRTAYIYANIKTTYNPLGFKLYGDGTSRESWVQNRIELSYSFSSTPLAGQVLVGSCFVGGSPGGTPEAIVVNQIIPSIAGAVARNVGNNDIVTTHRAGRSNELISVSNLYQAFENWGIKRLTSTTKTNDDSFQFAIPAGSDVYLLSAKADLATDSNYSYSNIDNSTGNYNWFINKTLNTLTVSFDQNVGNYATCIVCLDRTL